MKFFFSIGLLVLVVASSAFAQQKFYRTFTLDERMPYQIPVTSRQGMTTLLFPVPPQNYAAARIALVEAGQPVPDFSADLRVGFIMVTRKGANYASIRAVRPNEKDTLTVFLDGKAYQLFVATDDVQPAFTVQFINRRNTSSSKQAAVTPARLVACLKKAQAYAVLAKYYPEKVADVQYVTPARIISYSGFRVLIDEIMRFNPEDTLVFRILLENNTDQEIFYKPQQLSVRVGNSIFDASVVDASGIMPPRSVTPAYFAVTGTPDGGRNDIDPALNKFTVLVPRVLPPPAHREPEPEKPTAPKTESGPVQLGQTSRSR